MNHSPLREESEKMGGGRQNREKEKKQRHKSRKESVRGKKRVKQSIQLVRDHKKQKCGTVEGEGGEYVRHEQRELRQKSTSLEVAVKQSQKFKCKLI